MQQPRPNIKWGGTDFKWGLGTADPPLSTALVAAVVYKTYQNIIHNLRYYSQKNYQSRKLANLLLPRLSRLKIFIF